MKKQLNDSTSILFFLLLSLLLSTQAFGFAEDTCLFYKNKEKSEVLPLSVNCFDLQCMDGVEGASQTATKCAVKGLAKYTISAGLGKVNARNSLHYDVMWLNARLLGFTTKDATTIAMYSQATDLGTYTHFNRLGKKMATSDNLAGLVRTNQQTLGFGFHFVPRFQEGNTLASSPLNYNTDSSASSPFDSSERPLNQVRKWAFGEHNQLCRFGLADEQGNCLQSSIFVQYSPLYGINIPGQSAPLGNQDVFGSTDENGNVTYTDGSSIKGTAAALGVYLHIMGDRLSHFQCSDVAAIQKDGDNFRLVYPDTCGQALHISLHYRETAHKHAPERTKKMVEYSWLEMEQFIAKTNYTKDSAAPQNLDAKTVQTQIQNALELSCSSKRMEALCNISKTYRLGWHDGNVSCQYSHELCNDDVASQDNHKHETTIAKNQQAMTQAPEMGCSAFNSQAAGVVSLGILVLLGLICLRRKN